MHTNIVVKDEDNSIFTDPKRECGRANHSLNSVIV